MIRNEQEAVAWQDASGRELHDFIKAYQKRDMIAAGGIQAERAKNYSIALYTSPVQPAGTDAIREALEPFASVLEQFDPTDEDDETQGTLVVGSTTDYGLTLGDFRRAFAALNPTSEKNDG